MYEFVAFLVGAIGAVLIVLQALGKLPRERARWQHDNFGKFNLPAGYVAGAFFFIIGCLIGLIF